MTDHVDENIKSSEDSKQLVQTSYDKIALRYKEWTDGKPTARLTYIEKMFAHAKDISKFKVLELGCGAGLPCSKVLAQKCAHVTANDISEAQIGYARANVPFSNVEFVAGDMTKLLFEPESLQAVVAYYSIIHLPRDEQKMMINRLWTWLSSGGYVVCNFGTHDNPGNIAADWLGSEMYWSGFEASTYLHIFREAGFTIIEQEILEDDEDGRLVPFLWILARKV